MSSITILDKQEDMVDEAVSVLESLIPTPETLWGNLSKEKLQAADCDTMREICWLSNNDFNRFQQAVTPATRKMEIVFLVRATVFKAEANKISGFLREELAAAKIAIASNAADFDIATNAAVYRLLTKMDDARPDNKYRVSRNAKAIKGIEVTCADAGVSISFATASEILRMVGGSSRSELCKLADRQTKLDREDAADESVSSQAEDSKDQQQSSGTNAVSAGDGDGSTEAEEEPMGETARQVVVSPPIAPEFLAQIGPKDVDTFPESDLHLVAVVRAGQHFLPKGLVCSGAKARALIQKAMAG